MHIRQIPLWPTNPVDFDSYPISLVLAWGKKIRFLAYKIIFYAPVESSGSQETLLGTGFWLDDKEKWTTKEWLFKCRYIFGAWCVACFVFHVSQNFDSTRKLDLFVLYFQFLVKWKKNTDETLSSVCWLLGNCPFNFNFTHIVHALW